MTGEGQRREERGVGQRSGDRRVPGKGRKERKVRASSAVKGVALLGSKGRGLCERVMAMRHLVQCMLCVRIMARGCVCVCGRTRACVPGILFLGIHTLFDSVTRGYGACRYRSMGVN